MTCDNCIKYDKCKDQTGQTPYMGLVIGCNDVETRCNNFIERRAAGDAVTPSTRGEVNETVDRETRYRQIIEVLRGKELTAKEIAVEMQHRGYIPTSERNFTAPRLTELSHKGVVEPIGKKKCEYTGKTVAVYAIREEQARLFY